MTTINSTLGNAHEPGLARRLGDKLPVAILVVAVLMAAASVAVRAGNSEPAVVLPDPVMMLENSYGKPPAAELVDYWRERAAATPADVVVLTRLAAAQMIAASESGNLELYEVAEVNYRTALKENQNSDSAMLGLARALAAQHGFIAARDLVTSSNSAPAKQLAVKTILGDLAMELGDVETAGRLYAEVDAAKPGRPEIGSRLARLAFLAGDTDRAIELSTQGLVAASSLDLRPASAAFYWFQLANYQQSSGESEAAFASLENALIIDPNHLGSRELYGHVLVSLDRYDEALDRFLSLIEAGPAADLHGELEKLYRVRGSHTLADDQASLGLELAAAQAERFPAERRHVIGFYADHDPLAALSLAELDFEQRQDIYSHDALAWALHVNGRSAEAAAHAKAALSLGTQDARLLYHVGMIELANGEVERAEQHLSAALQLDSNFDVRHAPLAIEALASLG
ncbi:MAG: tetratricopeptide repeat protein [Acidimicrobiales bacterium]